MYQINNNVNSSMFNPNAPSPQIQGFGGPTMDEFNQWLASLPPDQRAQVVQGLSRDHAGLASQADKQRASAVALRDSASTPEMRTVGDVAVAANPLEFLAEGGKFLYGQHRANQATDRLEKAMADQEALRRRMGEFYRGR